MKKTYDVIIPVYHPGADFEKVLSGLFRQTVKPEKILLLQTLEEGEKPFFRDGCESIPVKKEEFDHAATRRMGVEHSDADCFLMMTQDAVPAGDDMAEKLLEGLAEEKNGRSCAMCYARQLPKEEAGEIERYTRSFNYPEASLLKVREDTALYGIKTFFASDVCCMYDRKAYEKAGGFTEHAIFNEDMIMAHSVMEAGYAVSYRADACCLHSHSYTAVQQFRRNFDLGISQAMHPEVFSGLKSEKEGIRLIRNTAGHLLKTGKGLLIPKLILDSGAKFLGYRFGKGYRKLPDPLIFCFTGNRQYIKKHIQNKKRRITVSDGK